VCSEQSALDSAMNGTKVRSFRDLQLWQKAMDLTTSVYRLTQAFPREELFGLTNQMRRSALSVPSNIAEGQGSRQKDLRNYRKVEDVSAGRHLCSLVTAHCPLESS